MDGWIKIGTEIETKDFDSQITYIEQQLDEIEYKLKQADMGFDVGDVGKLEAQYEKLGNQLLSLRQKQADLNKTDLSNLQKQKNGAYFNYRNYCAAPSFAAAETIGKSTFPGRCAKSGGRDVSNRTSFDRRLRTGDYSAADDPPYGGKTGSEF